MEVKVKEVKEIGYCPKGEFHIPYKKCKECLFYGGIQNDSINCTYDFIPMAVIHVTSFTDGDNKYESRYYDEKLDGKIEGDDPYDYCQKCDMFKKLPNGKTYCAIRIASKGGLIEPFICYEGEIWKKVKSDV